MGERLGQDIRYSISTTPTTDSDSMNDMDSIIDSKDIIPSLAVTSTDVSSQTRRIQIAFSYHNRFRIYDLVNDNRWESRDNLFFDDAKEKLKCNTAITSITYSSSSSFPEEEEDITKSNIQTKRLAIACSNDNKI